MNSFHEESESGRTMWIICMLRSKASGGCFYKIYRYRYRDYCHDS